MSMPTKKTVPVCSACGTVRPKLFAIEGAVKPMASTCIASAAQTSPKMRNSFLWKLPVPAASSASSTVIARVAISSTPARRRRIAAFLAA